MNKSLIFTSGKEEINIMQIVMAPVIRSNMPNNRDHILMSEPNIFHENIISMLVFSMLFRNRWESASTDQQNMSQQIQTQNVSTSYQPYNPIMLDLRAYDILVCKG